MRPKRKNMAEKGAPANKVQENIDDGFDISLVSLPLRGFFQKNT
jgi:hypothetical protein